MTSKKEFNSINLFLTIVGFLACLLFCYVFYRSYQNEQSETLLMIIPLILGIIVENKRLSSSWKSILLNILGTFIFSLFAFIPTGKENAYNFEHRIEIWPYWFIIIFVIISVIAHQKKIIPKLTEGITLLQSFAIIYWVLDIGFLNEKNIFAYIAMGIGLIFALISIIHAFSTIKLTNKFRLVLSIWSCIIMIIFAVDHIYRVFKFDYFSENKMLYFGFNAFQYFLLGVSLIYIFQNIYMLIVYLPERRNSYGKKQMETIKKMNETHINRFSQSQVKIIDSLLALAFSVSIYYVNYYFKIVPRHTLIWLVFWIFPFIIWLKNILRKKIKSS